MNQTPILALETASQPGGLALALGHDVIYHRQFPPEKRTTETFAIAIEQALARQNWSPADIQVISVCQGPGSFTGLRVGVTAAKCFAYATGCELLGIHTMDVIATQVGRTRGSEVSGSLWVVMDAQRSGLYLGQYDVKPDGSCIRVGNVDVVSIDAFMSVVGGAACLTGSGIQKIAQRLPPGVRVLPEAQWQPQATQLALLTAQRYANGERDDVFGLLPNYYRRSAAEEKADRK